MIADYEKYAILIARSPAAVLLARRMVVCPTCTVDEALPVMIEEGSQWERHAQSKGHKGLAAKLVKERKQHVHTVAAQGKGDSTRGEHDEQNDSAGDPLVPFDDLFST